MESQGNEKEYRRKILESFGKEWATADREKRLELNKRMNRWQELMKSGVSASQAYNQVMGEESDESPVYIAIEEESDYRMMEEPSGKQLAIPSPPRMRKAPFVILGLALVVAIVYCVVITGDRNALNTELASVQSVLTSTQSELASTQAKLGSTKQTLASTQSELGSTKVTLASTQAELGSTKQTLASTQSELGSTKVTLASTQAELGSTKEALGLTQAKLGSTEQTLASVQQDKTNLQAKLSSAQQQLAVAQETLEGLGITLSTSKERYGVLLIDNPTAMNPTWSQLKTFLSQDQTEKYTYIEDVYDCTEFSRDVHNNAEAAGIRAAVVRIDFKNEEVGHALNAFLTSDYGLVYVDCTEIDTIAHVKTGKEYRAVDLYKITRTNVRNDYWWDALSSYYYIPSSFLTIIRRHVVTSSIIIYW